MSTWRFYIYIYIYKMSLHTCAREWIYLYKGVHRDRATSAERKSSYIRSGGARMNRLITTKASFHFFLRPPPTSPPPPLPFFFQVALVYYMLFTPFTLLDARPNVSAIIASLRDVRASRYMTVEL